MPRTIFETCRPRKDVESGVTKDEQFAADLAQVVNKTAPPEYIDPAIFFRHTYPTRGLQDLLKAVCHRLNGEGTISPIIRLHTQYGGGKTHGLIALVHAVRGMQGVENAGAFISPAFLPKGSVRIAALDGENSDPANGRRFADGAKAYTLWGELAHELAGRDGYELVRKSDEQAVAPGAETLRKLFGDDPTLIILDEISVYLRKAEQARPGSAKQFAAFVHGLIKAVDSSPKAALVLTLALGKEGNATDAYAEENQLAFKAFQEAESVVSRKSTQLNPTDEDETAQVLRTRLFESVDAAAAAETYSAYAQLWENNRGTLPADPISRDEFVRTYPLHPLLLNMLTEKTSSLDTFQRTRGMLRLLARTAHSLWKNKPADAFVIHTHHIDPGFEKIRDEITVRLNQGSYMAALKSDVAELQGNSQATAQLLDSKLYPGQLPAASYVARTVFLHSIAGVDAARGISAEHLRLSICSPLLEPAFIEQARTAFVGESLYLDDRPGAPLRLMTEPNLKMVIRRKMNELQLSAVQDRLSTEIGRSYSQPNGIFAVSRFAAGPYQVPDDNERPQLVVMDYQSVTTVPDPQELPSEIEDIFQHKGSEGNLRKYRNNLVFLVADERSRETMIEATRRVMALEALTKSDVKDLPKHQREELARGKEDAGFKMSSAILQCYRHLFYPAKTPMPGANVPLAYRLIELPIGEAGNGQFQVKTALEDDKKLIGAHATPPAAAYVRDSTPLNAKGEMSTRELLDEFRCLPKFPILEHHTPLITLIRDGISKGVFVFREGANQISGPGDPVPAIHIDDNSFVMTMDHAKAKHFWPRPEPLKATLRTSSATVAPGSTVELTLEVSGGVGPYTYSSSLAAFQHPAPTTQNVISARVTVDATKTFTVEVQDQLGNKQTGSVWISVSRNAAPHQPCQPSPGREIITLDPPSRTRIELTAEGPLVTALKELWDKARKAKVERLQRVVITMHDPVATWKVHGAMIIEKCAAISCEFNAEMTGEGVDALALNFSGAIAKADNVRSFLDAAMKAASHKNFDARYTLQFASGLSLADSAPETLTANLTKFGGTEAYVEAHAQDGQEEVAA